jgi:hypothetical protein
MVVGVLLHWPHDTPQSAKVGTQIIIIIIIIIAYIEGGRGSVVVKALCYKPEGRGFEIWWGEWFLSSYLILLVALGPGVYSASNRNEYQKHKNNVSGE